MNICHKCTCPKCAIIGPLRSEIEEELRKEQVEKIKELAQKIRS